ncbi:expressed unknown protein [Seminavis robusta]|uniref:Uncharacterized protein n=1 Tax=Seminavis robusta TaxID=568900 RepID=A0A9N8DNK5_9STRA|nr:expressed unknown protein [Seminavis robusta]|eukprot:Sro247_g098050.1 n/a (70) ;mRNA; f:26772-27065
MAGPKCCVSPWSVDYPRAALHASSLPIKQESMQLRAGVWMHLRLLEDLLPCFFPGYHERSSENSVIKQT